MLELTSVDQVAAWIKDVDRVPATFIRLDLHALAADLASIELRKCVFVSCQLPSALAGQITTQDGSIVGRRSDLPFEAPPGKLYGVADIYKGFDPSLPGSWATSFDRVAYLWFMDPVKQRPKQIGIADTISAKLHDTGMEQETLKFLGMTGTIAIMGGHDRLRNDKAFSEVAKLARTLRRKGKMIVTGGGPGFMEAGNLGAFLAPYPDDALDAAMAILKQAPTFTDTHAWLSTACEVRAKFLNGDWRSLELAESANLGIPTWLYGHEPPNMFSTHIGKFFYNSLREDGLVTIANSGIIFAEGNAGTVQEVFQDATQNYYRQPDEAPTPMVLYNSTAGFWNLPCDAIVDSKRKKPLYPLIKQLANERSSTVFDKALLLSEDVEAIAAFLLSFKPDAPTKGMQWRKAMLSASSLRERT